MGNFNTKANKKEKREVTIELSDGSKATLQATIKTDGTIGAAPAEPSEVLALAERGWANFTVMFTGMDAVAVCKAYDAGNLNLEGGTVQVKLQVSQKAEREAAAKRKKEEAAAIMADTNLSPEEKSAAMFKLM